MSTIRSRDISKERDWRRRWQKAADDSSPSDPMLSSLETRSAWMKCVSFFVFVFMSVCHLLFCTFTHKQCARAQKTQLFWSDCWAQPQRPYTSTSLQRRSRGSAEVEEEEEEHEKVIEARQRREEATVSHVQRHSWCDWAVSVSARWVTEKERWKAVGGYSERRRGVF